ncbi:hypothetical protein BGZ68_001341 [Mortierella alpina]|nr:hypothetical protein BGZ68_001341 [Mortierella alpina]
MEDTQSFRLLGSTDIEEILCDQVDGQKIVYWEDIEQAFPGVQKVKSGRLLVSMMRDSNRIRIEPHCIKHYPGVVLDVFVSSDTTQVHVSSPVSTPSLVPDDDHARTPADSPTIHPPINPPAYAPTADPPASSKAAGSKPRFSKASSAKTAVPVKTQHQTKASLGKPNQFYEQPFPRLPIVLPTDVRRVSGLVKPSPQQFKLYFLCEHEAHRTKGLKETNRIHLADHAGYDISHRMDLFKEFGTYILAVMRAVRADIPSMIVAPLASSTVLQELSRIEDYTQESISSLFDMAIGYLEGMNTGHDVAHLQDIPNPFVFDGDNRPHQHKGPLSFYLQSEDQTLGNLYRSVTNGDVRWVCRAHFQQNHDNEPTRRFREVIEENQGSLVDETGTVDIKLANESKATAFFEVLSQVRSVQELAVSFTWNAPLKTLQSLANAILKSNVVSFVFIDSHNEGFTVTNPSIQRRFDPLVQLLAKGRLQLVRLRQSDGFFQHVSFFQHISSLSAYKSFPTIHKLYGLRVSNGPQFSLFLRLVQKCIALQKITVKFPDNQVPSWTTQCIEACPSLEELELSWFTSDFAPVFDLLAYANPLFTKQQVITNTGSQSSLRHLRMYMGDLSVTAERSENGDMLVSTTSSQGAFLRPLLNRFGWAVNEISLHQVFENDYFDLRPLVQSIENHGGVSNLQSLILNECQLAPVMRLPVLEIIERSPGLKTLALRLDRVTEDPSVTNVNWCLAYLGPNVTKLNLMPRRGKIHPHIASLLSRGGFSSLEEIHVFNQREEFSSLEGNQGSNDGTNSGDIRWLINLVSTVTGSRLSQTQARKSNAQALSRLTVSGMQVQDAHWTLLFEALDFKSLTCIDLSSCSIRSPQLTLLLNCLPKDGLLQDGYPVPLTYLNISSFPPKQSLKAQETVLRALVAERAPFATLII